MTAAHGQHSYKQNMEMTACSSVTANLLFSFCLTGLFFHRSLQGRPRPLKVSQGRTFVDCWCKYVAKSTGTLTLDTRLGSDLIADAMESAHRWCSWCFFWQVCSYLSNHTASPSFGQHKFYCLVTETCAWYINMYSKCSGLNLKCI